MPLYTLMIFGQRSHRPICLHYGTQRTLTRPVCGALAALRRGERRPFVSIEARSLVGAPIASNLSLVGSPLSGSLPGTAVLRRHRRPRGPGVVES